MFNLVGTNIHTDLKKDNIFYIYLFYIYVLFGCVFDLAFTIKHLENVTGTFNLSSKSSCDHKKMISCYVDENKNIKT